MKIVEMTFDHHDAVNQFSIKTQQGIVFSEKIKNMTEQFLSRNRGFNFVAIDWNRVVGYLVGACHNEIAYLNNFGVEKSYRGSQIAANLLEHFSSAIQAKGATTLKLSAESHHKKFDINDLGSLKMFRHLTALHLFDRRGDDLRLLADLSQLLELKFELCSTQDFSPVSALTQLTHLTIQDSYCEKFPSLANLNQLTHLHLRGCRITDVDIHQISNLSKLTYLYLSSDAVTDISPLTKLENLTELHFTFVDNIKDFSPIGSISSLKRLSFDGVRRNLSEITFLRSLPHLTDLSITGRNQLVSVGVPACDFSPISDLTNLTRLDLSYNAIRDISFLLPLSKLTELELKGNRIQDRTPIESLRKQSLKQVNFAKPHDNYDWSQHGQDPGLQNS